MTSARQIRANRVNARASSGPRMTAGKARSAHNAFRHGFNVPVSLDPTLASDVEALAQRIAGKGADANVLEPARRVAEAQIDLRRVRFYRHFLIERALVDETFQTKATKRAQFKLASSIFGKRIKVPLSDAPGRTLCPAPLEGPEKLAAILETPSGESLRVRFTTARPERASIRPSSGGCLLYKNPSHSRAIGHYGEAKCGID